MAAATLGNARSVAKSRVVSRSIPQHFPASDAFMSLPEPSALATMDQVTREITIFLHEHPGLTETLRPVDLDRASDDDKVMLLEQIREALGIPKLRRKTLGYVGS